MTFILRCIRLLISIVLRPPKVTATEVQLNQATHIYGKPVWHESLKWPSNYFKILQIFQERLEFIQWNEHEHLDECVRLLNDKVVLRLLCWGPLTCSANKSWRFEPKKSRELSCPKDYVRVPIYHAISIVNKNLRIESMLHVWCIPGTISVVWQTIDGTWSAQCTFAQDAQSAAPHPHPHSPCFVAKKSHGLVQQCRGQWHPLMRTMEEIPFCWRWPGFLNASFETDIHERCATSPRYQAAAFCNGFKSMRLQQVLAKRSPFSPGRGFWYVLILPPNSHLLKYTWKDKRERNGQQLQPCNATSHIAIHVHACSCNP